MISDSEPHPPRSVTLDVLLEALPDALAVLDAQGIVERWNPVAERVFGIAAAAALGQAFERLPLPPGEHWPSVFDAIRSGEPRLVDWIDPASGADCAMHLRVVPLAAHGRPATLLHAHDVTREVQARSRAEERTEEMRQQAVRRDLFFSAMSHDLRTPITAVMGYSELLLDGVIGELSEPQLEMIERISQVAHHLSELLNDVLDLAKLDAGRMELRIETVELVGVIEDASLEIEPQASAKRLRLVRALPQDRSLQLRADPMRLRQVLVNLLSNAVKFTDEGTVRIGAHIDGAMARITVQDTGPGLPAGQEEMVFEDYVQIASGRGAKQEPGSGLGLAIARRLARAMGGDLAAERSAGVGATFVLTLPLHRSG
jgi:PAS domain S-box-containing protein